MPNETTKEIKHHLVNVRNENLTIKREMRPGFGDAEGNTPSAVLTYIVTGVNGALLCDIPVDTKPGGTAPDGLTQEALLAILLDLRAQN